MENVEETKEIKTNRKKAKAKLSKIVGKDGSIGINKKKNVIEVRLKSNDEQLRKKIPSKLHGIGIEIVVKK